MILPWSRIVLLKVHNILSHGLAHNSLEHQQLVYHINFDNNSQRKQAFQHFLESTILVLYGLNSASSRTELKF